MKQRAQTCKHLVSSQNTFRFFDLIESYVRIETPTFAVEILVRLHEYLSTTYTSTIWHANEMKHSLQLR